MNLNINFTRHAAFGYVVHCKKISAGYSYAATLTSDTDGPGLGNITLVTKGLITGVNRDSGASVVNRVPGYTNHGRTGMLAGIYDFTAQEDSEWWCINKKVNKNCLPDVEIFTASMGQVIELTPGTKLLLCQGRMSAEETEYSSSKAFYVRQQQTTFVAGEQCYGFIFKE
jgi:hypothetical protein